MKYGNFREQKIAEEVNSHDALMCSAKGCPNRWSVDAGNGPCCSAHAWADRREWPRITEAETHKATDAAHRRSNPQPKLAPKPLTRGEKASILLRLRQLFMLGVQSPKAWAHRLKEREEAGELLSDYARKCWRAALRAELERETA